MTGPDARDWAITWSLAPPDWATVEHPDMPEGLVVRVRIATAQDGFAITAVLAQWEDGRAIEARDLRRVKLPAAWMLASVLVPPPDSPALRPARPGPGGHGAEHWQAVLGLRDQAQRVAPRAPVRWMRSQWPGEPSDATMRRWIKQARERAAISGQAGPSGS